MSQTKRNSLIEALTNTAIGYCINYTANLIVFPFFGMHISPKANILLGLIYTGISIVRGYVLRRFFNRLTGGARESRAAGVKMHVYSGMAKGVISPEQAAKILDDSRARNEARP
ncbi:hypothetical protein [Burkholderia cepacia]|uniref:DUF7220 family protein n=1 Tax=Burkholderia cepacia TaxID=292 RepID=UPI001F19A161|nr:hypothetical protein [Burkholderia cepacia]MCE4125793.1 hypothetical protein [Burkholderia cepacia]